MIIDAIVVRLKPKERAERETRHSAGTTEQRDILRIKIVLEAAEGTATRAIVRELETTPTTVGLWRERFAREGLDGLKDFLRSRAPPIYNEGTDKHFHAVLHRPLPKSLRAGRSADCKGSGQR